MNLLTRWQQSYKHTTYFFGVAKTLCKADWVDYSAHIRNELAKRLHNLDTETIAALKTLLKRPQPGAVSHGVIPLVLHNEYDAVKLFIRHYDERINLAKWSTRNNDAAYWIEEVLVDHYKLPDWELPVALESDIIGTLKTLHDEHIKPGSWLVECLMKHQDKTDRIIELLRHRDVATLADMEALLSDDVPASLSQGAL